MVLGVADGKVWHPRVQETMPGAVTSQQSGLYFWHVWHDYLQLSGYDRDICPITDLWQEGAGCFSCELLITDLWQKGTVASGRSILSHFQRAGGVICAGAGQRELQSSVAASMLEQGAWHHPWEACQHRFAWQFASMI